MENEKAIGKKKTYEFLYNANVKEQFYEENLSNLTKSVLQKIDFAEQRFGKNMQEMDLTEFKILLSSFNSKSLQALQTYLSTIRKYNDFTNEKFGVNYGIPTKVTTVDLKELINDSLEESVLLTGREYEKIINNHTLSYQDLALVVLLWNGLKGEDYIDIINLKHCDIKKLNYTEKEMDILKKAIKEDGYSRTDSKGELILQPFNEGNDYVIKSTISKKTSGLLPVKPHTIKIRIQQLAGLVGNNMTGYSIYTSGLVVKMLELFKFNIPSYADMVGFAIENDYKISKSKISRVTNVIYNKMIKEVGLTKI